MNQIKFTMEIAQENVLSTPVLNPLEELAKFISLQVKDVPNGMFSSFIDSAWHKLTQNEDEYHQFCMKHAGRHITHLEMKGYGDIPWVKDYEDKFGTLGDEWFCDENGNLSVENRAKYHTTRSIKSGWDCGTW